MTFEPNQTVRYRGRYFVVRGYIARGKVSIKDDENNTLIVRESELQEV